MIESAGRLHFESASWQLNKWQEELCGDQVETVRTGESHTVAVADGLGSGVKANILATLTAKIAANMIKEGAEIGEVMATLAATLPVCRERELAYSTISVCSAKADGSCYLAEFDSPQALLVRVERVEDLPRVPRVLSGRTIYESRFSMQSGDILLMMSDGVLHAGLGKALNFGWQRENIVDYIRRARSRGLCFRDLGRGLRDTCLELYGGRPGDDCTVAVLAATTPQRLTLLSGPPAARDMDQRVVSDFLSRDGLKVVCGGSTAQMVARESGVALVTELAREPGNVPPPARMTGVDLVTEGILTLTAALGMVRRFAETGQGMNRAERLHKDAASMLADMLINRSTHIDLIIGDAVNAAHTAEELGYSLALRQQVAEDLARYLRLLGKEVGVYRALGA